MPPKMPSKKTIPPKKEARVFEPVPASWLAKALLATFVVIVLSLYLIYVALFSVAQWQLVLTPTHIATRTPTDSGLHFQSEQFGIDANGLPQRTGWFVPAETAARYSNYTVLYLHSGTGELQDTLPTLTMLHTLGINVFAPEYRGYGASHSPHPNQQRMNEDAASAFAYLTTTKHIMPDHIILFGDGVGATLAANLAAQNTSLAAVVLREPPVDLESQAAHDSRGRLLPVRLLFHERFEIQQTLAALKTPKLILATKGENAGMQKLMANASSPKKTVTISASANPDMRNAETFAALQRFFDDNLSAPPSRLEIPSH